VGSSIEWTDETWNIVTGCDRISPGCDHCYIERTIPFRIEGRRFDEHGRMGIRLHPDRLDKPLHWRKPRLVFVNSLSDLFHKDVPADFVLAVWSTMSRAPQHTFQLLTKRPQRMQRIVDAIAFTLDDGAARLGDPFTGGEAYLWPGTWDDEEGDPWPVTEADIDGGGEQPLPNVWLGTSIESDRYTFRADHLRATPAAVRWLSLEPLLGALPSLSLEGIDWVVVGGESGPGARPMHPGWVRDIRDRCVAADVPFFFKQWGEWLPLDAREHLDLPPGQRQWTKVGGDLVDGGAAMVRVGKKTAGRELDGRTWDQYPEAATS